MSASSVLPSLEGLQQFETTGDNSHNYGPSRRSVDENYCMPSVDQRCSQSTACGDGGNNFFFAGVEAYPNKQRVAFNDRNYNDDDEEESSSSERSARYLDDGVHTSSTKNTTADSCTKKRKTRDGSCHQEASSITSVLRRLKCRHGEATCSKDELRRSVRHSINRKKRKRTSSSSKAGHKEVTVTESGAVDNASTTTPTTPFVDVEHNKRTSSTAGHKEVATESAAAAAVTTTITTTTTSNPIPPSLPNPGIEDSSSLRFMAVTWNIWFGFGELGMNPHVEPRMRELVRLVLEHDAKNRDAYGPLWFVGLQEVTQESLPIAMEELQAGGFTHLVMQKNYPLHFSILAIKEGIEVLDSGWRDFEVTVTGRGFCYARVKVGGKELLVATTHMESPKRYYVEGRRDTGAQHRCNQLLEWQTFCQEQFNSHVNLRACIFMGDMNWNDEDRGHSDFNMADILSIPFQDAWKRFAVQHPENSTNKCYTYDALTNPMLCSGGFRSRIDRCLVFFRNEEDVQKMNCPDVTLLGKDKIPDLFFDKSYYNQQKKHSVIRPFPTAPSDHYGLVAALGID